MKDFKGTQGKWTSALTYSNFETHILSGSKRIAEVKHYNDGTGGLFENDPDFNEGRANAQLIVTAPELLESLQIMVELFDNNCPEGTTGQSACNQSKSVINKALGL